MHKILIFIKIKIVSNLNKKIKMKLILIRSLKIKVKSFQIIYRVNKIKNTMIFLILKINQSIEEKLALKNKEVTVGGILCQ